MASNDSRDASRSLSSPCRSVQLRQSPLPNRVLSLHSEHLVGLSVIAAIESVRPGRFIFQHEPKFDEYCRASVSDANSDRTDDLNDPKRIYADYAASAPADRKSTRLNSSH